MTSETIKAPLTRREAREIERRTGVRPVAGAGHEALAETVAAQIATGAVSADVHDTSKIERNAVTALVSVFPTEAIDRAAVSAAANGVEADANDVDAVPAAFAGRGLTLRAAKPAALVARSKRRKFATVAVAASAAAAVTSAIVLPAGGDVNGNVHQANLLTALDESGADSFTQTSADAPVSVDSIAAPEVSVDRDQEFNVFELDAESVTSSVTSPGVSTGTDTTGGVSTTAYPNTAGAGIVETALAYNGWTYHSPGWSPETGFDCIGFVRWVYMQNGIDVGSSISGLSGTVVSDPQPGDIVVYPNYHVGIYLGPGQMIHASDWGVGVKIGGYDWDDHYFLRING